MKELSIIKHDNDNLLKEKLRLREEIKRGLKDFSQLEEEIKKQQDNFSMKEQSLTKKAAPYRNIDQMILTNLKEQNQNLLTKYQKNHQRSNDYERKIMEMKKKIKTFTSPEIGKQLQSQMGNKTFIEHLQKTINAFRNFIKQMEEEANSNSELMEKNKHRIIDLKAEIDNLKKKIVANEIMLPYEFKGETLDNFSYGEETEFENDRISYTPTERKENTTEMLKDFFIVTCCEVQKTQCQDIDALTTYPPYKLWEKWIDPDEKEWSSQQKNLRIKNSGQKEQNLEENNSRRGNLRIHEIRPFLVLEFQNRLKDYMMERGLQRDEINISFENPSKALKFYYSLKEKFSLTSPKLYRNSMSF